MPAGALALVLASAAMHAGWNLIVKASGDRLVAGWAQATLGAAAFAPLLLFDGLDAGAWRVAAFSGVVHLSYNLLLVGAYERADLSAVYPVARGTAPLLVAVGSFAFLGDRLGAAGAVGVGLITGGLLWVALRSRQGRGLGWALATGVAIAFYTVIDAGAVRGGADALRYVTAVFVVNALLFLPIVTLRRRGRLVAELRATPMRYVLAGVLSVGAYALVLVAARMAPVAMVAAVRETAVVLGALGGWLILKEAMGRVRLAGAAAVALGVAVLALA